MERLTEYFEVGAYTEKKNIIDVSDKFPLFENGVIMGKAIDRLAEFEDFMEQEEFTSLEDLKAYIKLQSKGSKDLIQETQALKDRWQKLKDLLNDKISCLEKQVGFTEFVVAYDIVLDKMQELEKE